MAEGAHEAGVAVHLDDSDVGAEGEGRAVLPEVDCGDEIGPARRGPGRELGPLDCGRWHAGHREATIVGYDDVCRVGFELGGGQGTGGVEDLAGGGGDGAAADLERTGAACAGAPRYSGGVALDEAHLLQRDAEAVGDEHGKGGRVALAV